LPTLVLQPGARLASICRPSGFSGVRYTDAEGEIGWTVEYWLAKASGGGATHQRPELEFHFQAPARIAMMVEECTHAELMEVNMFSRDGEDCGCELAAELSANHNHDLDRARRIVGAAAESGADAVKLQTYTADTLTLDCDTEYFRIKGTIWEGRTLHDLYREAHTPWEWHAPLKELAENLGLEFFSTPFDSTAVDFLDDLGVARYKIASFEVVDIPPLRKIAATGKPVVMSTGMASLGEIEEAVSMLRAGSECGEWGNPQPPFSQCRAAHSI
jgi:hypothetical protein